MNCPFCGIPLSENADFCNNCGTFIPKDETSEKENIKIEIPDRNAALNNLFSMQTPLPVNEPQLHKKNKHFPQIKLPVLITCILCVIIILSLFIIPNIGVRRGIAGIGEPIQEETVGYIEKDIGGYEVSFYQQYTYEIEALVIHTKNYYGLGLGNRLAPRDIALAWGKVAEYNDKINFHWSQSGRWLRWKVNSYDELDPVGNVEYVSCHTSNNHLIASNNSVKRKIRKLKKGDHVKIIGYLVNVDAENKMGRTFLWNSSTTRTDTGDGACEVIYVTDVIWLD
ncbi:MAG: zinc ribbon domain-containing protein [Lachnospiraceae bacterium]|nr:zinc ribbon domain-containing protein [Lachnospiraceae bacterium]